MSHPEELVRRKAELRALLLRRRGAHPDRAPAGLAVADRLLHDLELPAGAVVAGYWPLTGEPDPRPCLERLAARGHHVALPRIQRERRPLAFHLWRTGEPLTAGGFGVMQPNPMAPRGAPDVLLVPLLGFDRCGRRLGYGKGYYDRALRGEGAARLAVGLAFALQEVEEVPVTRADELLDAVITELALHRCSPAGQA